MLDVVVGLDLGGSTLRAVVMDASDGGVLRESVDRFDAQSAEAVDRIARIAREQVERIGASWHDVSRVGIGLAGSVGDDRVSMATNIGALEGVDIESALSEALEREVVADNDANIAALSEWQALGPLELRDLAVISIGTGVGLGTIADGRLVRGLQGEAGEVGFLPLSPGPELVTLEDVAGGAALARAYAREAGGEALSGRAVLDLAVSGDVPAQRIAGQQARAIAWLAVLVRAILAPELIVLGGGIGMRPGFAEDVARHALRLNDGARIEIRRSILSEHSVAIGAAHLARLSSASSSSLPAHHHPLHPQTPAQA